MQPVIVLEMDKTAWAQRDAVVGEAKRWLRTPYHHMGRVKGVGVDCGMFLAEVYERAGVIPHVEPAAYPPDWAMHRNDEHYLDLVLAHAHAVEEPQMGDVVLYLVGRCYSHGGIVLAWPAIIHASFHDRGVCLADGTNGWLRDRSRRFYSPWGTP